MKQYVITNVRTGLYFNGTDFTASTQTARLFDEAPDLDTVRLIWGPDVEIEERKPAEPQRRLYLLRPVESTSWDSARGFVVAATSEMQARAFAADRCGDEGPGVWTRRDRSTCQRIDDDDLPLGVVIRDFLNG